MGAFDYLTGDHLLIDSCTWYAFTGDAEDSTYNKTPGYATGVTLRCMMAAPSNSWLREYPNAKTRGMREFWLPYDSTVDVRDKIAHNSLNYRVTAVSDWDGAGFSALCERLQGID